MPRLTSLFFLPALVLLSSLALARSDFISQDMCVRCHLLSESLGRSNPVLNWKASVHFRPDATCADCHGGDRHYYTMMERGHLGLPPRAEFAALCGKCHKAALTDFQSRPAGKPGEYKCSLTCSDCHGYHRVEKGPPAVITAQNCETCHPFSRAASLAQAEAETRAELAALDLKIADYRDEAVPVFVFEREAAGLKAEFARGFHSEPPARMESALAEVRLSARELDGRITASSPQKWSLSGALALAFLALLLITLIGYQKTLTTKEEEMAQTENLKSGTGPAPAPTSCGAREGSGKPGSSRLAWLALLIALAALALALQQRLMRPDAAVKAMNETLTQTVLPQLKQATSREDINTVYELKRMTVTLDEIKEGSPDPAVRAQVDQLKAGLQELSVKIMVGGGE